VTKQAERGYAANVDSAHLYAKPFNDPRLVREFAVVLELFAERISGGSILDVGCGPGWTTLLLAQAGFDAVGVDLAERMIEIAQERSVLSGVAAEFSVGDMEHLDLDRRDFDGALFFDCLHHCPEYPTALRRTFEHLRPGGYVVLMETTVLHRVSPHARQFSAEHGVTELGFSRGELRRALRAAGFGDVQFYFDPGACYRGLGGFLKSCIRLPAAYFLYWPQAKNIVVARKP
jgi:SAM-dependent methyltransferase